VVAETKTKADIDEKEMLKSDKKIRHKTSSVAAAETAAGPGSVKTDERRRRSRRLSVKMDDSDDNKDNTVVKEDVTAAAADSLGFVKQQPDDLPVKTEPDYDELKHAEHEVVCKCFFLQPFFLCETHCLHHHHHHHQNICSVPATL